MREVPAGATAKTGFLPAISSLLLLLGAVVCHAAPYPPEGKAVEWVQPGGPRIHLRVFGDEFHARTATADGHTVIFNPADSTYYYARRGPDGESLVSSGTKAGAEAPADVPPGLTESPARVAAIREANRKIMAPDADRKWAARIEAARDRRAGKIQPRGGESPAPPFTGTVTCLAIPVQFPDDPSTAGSDPLVFPTSHTKVARYCNEPGYTDDGNAGSIRDYFHDQSNGLVALMHQVAPIVTLPSPRNYYNYSDYPANTVIRGSGQAGRMLVADAIAALQAGSFDFSALTQTTGNRVLATSVLFAGPTSGVWAAGLWPHKFFMDPEINVGTAEDPLLISNYQITDAETPALYIGTYLHELSHLAFDFPDFYDYGGESAGLGVHCLMGGGNWLDGGRTPASLDIYLKSIAGWADISDLVPGQMHLANLSTTGNQGRRIFKPGSSTEYFLVENRGLGDKWAAYLPDHGIAIWHVDEAFYGTGYEQMTPTQHYQVSLEQADGEFDLEHGSNSGDSTDLFDNTDPFFNDGTLPDARWWNGENSGIAIEVLSAAGSSMTVHFSGEIPLGPALDSESLAWTTDTARPWGGQAITTHDGTDAAISGDVGDGESSWVETAVTGPGTVSFWWKVSSEAGADLLRFRLDGAELPPVNAISGNTDWTYVTAAIPAGPHTLRWTYDKNGSLSAGEDAAWLDEVTFYPGLAADVLVTTLADESNGSLNPALGTGTSLREAILHAPDPAVVGFLPGLSGGTVTLVSGQLNVTKNLTLDASPLAAGITVSGGDDTRVFDIQAGQTVAMKKLRIIDGEVSGDGGGIRNGGVLTLTDCEVASNEASDDGAGIFSPGELALHGTVISSNTSGSTGGGIFAEDVLTLQDCTVSGNTAATNGGGVYSNDGPAALSGCTFSANHAGGSPGGGAIDNDNGGTMTLTDCTLSGNTSDTKGGAIENDGPLTLLACTLSGNTSAGNGGAIEHVAGTLTLTSCTLSGNTGDVGGAIDGDGTSTIRLYSCTVSGNHATNNGGGIEESTGTLLLENTIVAGNTAAVSSPDLKVSAINTQGGVNLVSSTSGIGGSFTGIVDSPDLAALGSYGGTTQTMPPLPGSPAIDAGGATALTVDQRGLPRVMGAGVDIGSVEVQPAGLVTTAANSGPGSLRDTVAAIPAEGVITFAPALDGQTIVLTGGAILITKNLVIDASALEHLAISTGDASRIFEVTAGDTARLVNLQISDAGGMNGGAVSNGGNLTLEDCLLSYNDANNGGAIHNAEGGVIELIRCELRTNAAYFGGAIYNEGELTMSGCTLADNYADEEGGAVFNTGTLTAIDSAVSGNSANFFGGGILNAGILSMTRSTVSENFSADSGGGIYGGGVFTACTFTGNHSIGDGGAIVHGAGPLSLFNCTLEDNFAAFYGGGIETNGTTILLSCTVHGNTASSEGGGIAVGESGNLTLANSIVAGNRASELGPDIRGAIHAESGVNLLGTTAGVEAGFSGITGSPELMPLGNYGGPTPTMLPLPGSPVIDAGGTTPLTTDQRGLPRVSGAAADIGAVEVQPPLVVTNAADSGPGSLRALIEEAPDGSTITFDSSLEGGTVHVASGGENAENNPLVFGGNIILDASDLDSLTLLPSGHTSLARIGPDATVAIINIRFQNGWGGAIQNLGRLLLRDSRFTGNFAEEGGAIYNAADSALTLARCRLSANSANSGGAIHNEGTLALEDTVFSGNEAENRGGAVFSSGTLSAVESVFLKNGSSQFGGAIYSTGTLEMARCTVERNNSADSGAGMVAQGQAAISTSTFSDNHSGGSGGGILHSSGTLDLALCTFHANRALADYGGGVFSNGTVHVDACTISGNQAAFEGGGLYLDSSAQLTLRNSIVSGTSAPDSGPDLRGIILTQAGVNLLGVTEGITGVFTGITGDAMLPPPGLYGGPTLTMPPLPGSPAIDAGGSTFHAEDQRGFPRVTGGAPDIGAVETGNTIPVVTVNTTADENDGIGAGNVSLRDAVTGADPGSIVSFDPALAGDTILLTLGSLIVDKNLTVDASALPAAVAVSGDVPRAFEVPAGRHAVLRGMRVAGISNPDSASSDGAAVLNSGDLELSACTFSGNTGDQGGAIHNTFDGRLLMSGCTISDNEGQDEGGGLFNAGEADLAGCDFPGNGTFTDGAGIYNTGSLSLARCSFSGNFANFGGGGLFNDGPAELDRCEFTGNVSEGGFAGGILNSGTLTATSTAVCANESRVDGTGAGIGNSGTMTLNACIVSNNVVGYQGSGIHSLGPLFLNGTAIEGNRSEGDGAGIYLSGSTATLTGCTVAGNTSRFNGGGIYQGSGSLSLVNSTVAGNEAQEDLGGGIFSSTGTLSVASSTISGNRAVYEGGGIYLSAPVPLTLENTIIAGNTAFDTGADLRGSVGTQLGVNLLGTVEGADGTFSGIVGAALLEPLGLHGGPTLTMPPLAGSPAIDAGGATLLTTDQRGFSRVVGGTADIGAVETGNAIPVVTVDTTADEDDGIGTGNVSLRDAIAGAEAGAIVTFAPALDGQTITLAVDQLVVEQNLSIDASGLPGGITITGNVVRGFEIPTGRHALLTGVAVSGFNSGLDDGAAILNAGNLELRSCTFSFNTGNRGGAIHNSATAGLELAGCVFSDNEGVAEGGGIFNSGTAALSGCTLSSNGSSASGAALYNTGSMELGTCRISSNSANAGGGGLYNTGHAVLESCTFDGNVSEGGFGGGLVNSLSADLAAANCTFSANVSATDGDGAGIFNGGLLSLNHCTIAANGPGAAGNGGGIFNAAAGHLTLANSIVAGNSPSSSSPDIHGDIDQPEGVNQVSSVNGITTLFSGLVGDPELAPSGDYGGPVPVMPPLPGSPAIEAAELLPSTPPADQLGRPRPAGPAPDIGAVEALPFSLLGLADSDEDGIPDLLEPSLGLIVGADDSASDADGDGSSDAEEVGAMTDPLDPGSYFRFTAFAKTPGFDPVTNPGFAVSFPTFPGLTYSIEADDDLDFAGDGHEILVPGFIATGYSADFEITLPPGRGFARARSH